MKLLIAFFMLANIIACGNTYAATFTKSSTKNCDFTMVGEIRQGDYDAFKQASSEMKFKSLCLSSPGGSYFDGIKIATYINENSVRTRVKNGDGCYSACAIIFMAGMTAAGDFEYRDRTLEPGALLGFHAPYPTLPPGKFDEKDMEAAFAVAMAQAGDLAEFSGRYDSSGSRPPGGRELSALLPRPLLAKMLRKGHNEVYIIDTIGDAIMSGINIDVPQSSRKLSTEESVNIAENYEFARTLGYTYWAVQEARKDFTMEHVGKRLAFSDREKSVVLPFYDGIFGYAYIISPGGCCGDNLNHEIFSIWKTMIAVENTSNEKLGYAMAELYGPNGLSSSWSSTQAKTLSHNDSEKDESVWVPTWYRFGNTTKISSLANTSNFDDGDSPMSATDWNLHAQTPEIQGIIDDLVSKLGYIVTGAGQKFDGVTLGKSTKTDESTCYDTCRDSQTCRGFEFNLSDNNCVLYKTIADSRVDPRFVSGAKAPNAIKHYGGQIAYEYSKRAEFYGDMIPTDMSVKSDEACKQECDSIYDCQEYIFQNLRKMCTLHRGGRALQSDLSVERPDVYGLKRQR